MEDGELAFWDALTHDKWCPVADMQISPVGTRDVQQFCRRWHYAKHGGAMAWSYGIWDGPTLAGVVSYNTPTLPAQTAVFGPELARTVHHMGRLVCAETAPRNTESRLIAASLKLFAERVPYATAVLTYAAAGEGHVGYVYQATNALYLGMSSSSHYYRDQSGRRRAPKQNEGVNGNGNLSIPKALARGWTVHHEPGKHRYLYLLGDRRQKKQLLAQLRHPVLPYPKADVDG
jgi:hypothetical protein